MEQNMDKANHNKQDSEETIIIIDSRDIN
ncbi:spore coat protein [Bacillus subtilis]|nr:spore coat protein [Bacillus subtilis]MDI6567165.1 spore coat protein [Bacillus subtilis]